LFDERYERKTDKSGFPRFNLKSANHEIIGISESYASKSSRDRGIRAAKATVKVAEVIDDADSTVPILRRYTDIPSLIYLLTQKKITFLDPTNWDDQIDSNFMTQYKQTLKFRSLLAICFSKEYETYHHWRVFAGGSNGVCIEFDQAKLLSNFKDNENIICRDVTYLNTKQVRNKTDPLALMSLPIFSTRSGASGGLPTGSPWTTDATPIFDDAGVATVRPAKTAKMRCQTGNRDRKADMNTS